MVYKRCPGPDAATAGLTLPAATAICWQVSPPSYPAPMKGIPLSIPYADPDNHPQCSSPGTGTDTGTAAVPPRPPATEDAALRLPPAAGWDAEEAAPTVAFDSTLSALVDHLLLIEDRQLAIEDQQVAIVMSLTIIKSLVEELLP
jgi:hypothetical protein